MTTSLTQDVEAPHLSQPRVSILTAATIVNDTSRWEGGYSFVPEGCANGGLFDPCANPNGMSDPEYIPVLKSQFRPPSEPGDPPTITPFLVYTSVSRQTASLKDGRDVKALYDLADRQLSIVTSYYLEQELWSDTLGLSNPALQNAATTLVAGTALTATQALAELERGIAACNAGGNMMIHVTPAVLTYLVADTSVRRVGNVYLTPMDNIVVPGRGYPGTGPTGDGDAAEAVGQTEWMYASPQVQVRLSKDVLSIPERTDDLDVLRKAVDRRSNDITVYVERMVSATFDPECCLLAIEVTRPFDTTP